MEENNFVPAKIWRNTIVVSEAEWSQAENFCNALVASGMTSAAAKNETIKEIKKQRKQSKPSAKKSDAEIESTIQFLNSCGIDCDENGRPKQNHSNYIAALKYLLASTEQTLRFNEFSNEIYLNGKQFNDSIDRPMINRMMTDSGFGLTVKDTISDAIALVAHENRYHPVRDYLNELVWDGKKRASRMIVDFLGAEDNRINRTMTTLWLYASVKRIFEPGCKFDNILIMQGAQGGGKSILCQRLAKDKWYTENINIGDKDALIDVNFSWIIIMDELGNMAKKESNDVKNFLSRTQDTYRAPYGRSNITRQRHCTFIGSTNDATFLRDSSSPEERRYWIIECTKTMKDSIVWNQFTDDVVDQIWAEVMTWYRSNPSWSLNLPKELYDEYFQYQKKFKVENDNPLYDIISLALEKEYPFIKRKDLFYLNDDYDMMKWYSHNYMTDEEKNTPTHKIDVFPVIMIDQLCTALKQDKYKYQICQRYAKMHPDDWEVKRIRATGMNPISCMVRIRKDETVSADSEKCVGSVQADPTQNNNPNLLFS